MDTIDIDSETAELAGRLARLQHTTVGTVVKDAVLSRAQAAGLAPATTTSPLEQPQDWVSRTLAVLDTLPRRPDGRDRTIDDIIGYDEHGMP